MLWNIVHWLKQEIFVAATHDYICEQKLNFIEVNKQPKRGGSLNSERHNVGEEHCRVLCIFRLVSLPYACRVSVPIPFHARRRTSTYHGVHINPMSTPCHFNCCERHTVLFTYLLHGAESFLRS